MWGKKKPDGHELLALKKKQIETLRGSVPLVKELQRDTLFEVPLQIPNLALSITLPANFPNEGPMIKTTIPVAHPWVDPQMLVIGHPKLRDWNAHSNLGKIVKEIGKEMSSNPPRILPRNSSSSVSPDSSPYPSIGGGGSGSGSGIGFIPHSQIQGSNHSPSSSVSSVSSPHPSGRGSFSSSSSSPSSRPVEPIPELAQLNNQQLEELLNNDQKFEEFLLKHSKVKNTESVVKEIKEETERIAESNLKKEPQLKALQEALAQQKALIEVENAKLAENVSRLNVELQNYSSELIKQKLAKETQNAESESDDLGYSFSRGELPLQDFLKDFIQKRKLYHLRAAKLEMASQDPSILSRS